MVNLQQAISKRVLTPAQRARLSVEFSLDALLRASLKDRMDLYAKAVQNGLKTRNECRQLENDPPVTGGDQLTAQTNLAPLEMLGKIQGGGNAAQKTLSLSDCQIKLDGDSGKFAGYASVFGGTDSYGDTILRGAFESTLRNNGKPKMFYGHQWDIPIGKWIKAKEDDHGLFVEGELTPGLSKSADVHAALKHGTLDGLSIGGYLKKAIGKMALTEAALSVSGQAWLRYRRWYSLPTVPRALIWAALKAPNWKSQSASWKPYEILSASCGMQAASVKGWPKRWSAAPS